MNVRMLSSRFGASGTLYAAGSTYDLADDLAFLYIGQGAAVAVTPGVPTATQRTQPLMVTSTEETSFRSLVSGDGNRAASYLDPAAIPDGALPAVGQLASGEVATAFASPTAPAPLVVASGIISHTPYAAANSAGYLQAELSGRVTRIGAMVAWPTSALGVFALVIPSAAWASGTLPNAGFHLVVNGNGIWTLTRFTTGGSTQLANYQSHGRPQNMWGLGYVPIDVWLDPVAGRCAIYWPDGSSSVVSSAYLSSETANYAIWELYESNGSTDVPATMGRVWADTMAVSADAVSGTLQGQVGTAVAGVNASGAVTVDWSQGVTREVTLTGNATSLTFSNPPSRNTLLQLELIQDGTGSRTLAGVAATIKFAGAAAPTLSTTAARRDIFVFRFNGTNYVEVSRSMNVG